MHGVKVVEPEEEGSMDGNSRLQFLIVLTTLENDLLSAGLLNRYYNDIRYSVGYRYPPAALKQRAIVVWGTPTVHDTKRITTGFVTRALVFN